MRLGDAGDTTAIAGLDSEAFGAFLVDLDDIDFEDVGS